MASRARADTSGRFPNRSIDRAASRKASGASGSRWRSRTRSTLIRTISSGIDDGSVTTIRYPNRTTCSGSIRLIRIRANRSPTPGVSYSANAPMTAGWGKPPLRPRQRGRGQHQSGGRGGLDGRLQDGDHAPHGVSREHHAPGRELGDESRDDPSFVHHAGPATESGRRAEPRQVERQDPAEPGESRGDLEPVEMRTTETVDQHERRVARTIPRPVPHRSVQVDGRELGKVEAHGREPTRDARSPCVGRRGWTWNICTLKSVPG